MSTLFSKPDGDQENEHMVPSAHMSIHEHDESGGGEFLDEGLRMHEQPLGLRENTP